MGYERVWSCVHVMWSVAYVACGAAQLVAGIFFILGVPSWVLGCNLLTGSYNILMGIGVGMVACCGQVTPRRQETLLYMTVSILMANVTNIVVSEYGFYNVHIVKLMEEHQYNELIKYACFGTRGTAALILLISFLDSQLAFCSMQSAAVARVGKKQPKNLYYHHHRGGPGPLGVSVGSHEQVSDIEYIIPRQKSSSKAQQQQVYNAYSQSWVFDADSNNTSTTLVNPNGSLGGNSSSGSRDRDRYSCIAQQQQYQKKVPLQHHLASYQQHQYYDGLNANVGHGHGHGGDVVRGKQLIAKGNGLDCGLVVTDNRRVKGHLIDNPVVQIDEAASISDTTSNNSNSNSDRKLCYMKSFSRSASPIVLSACSSQLSLDQTVNTIQPQPHITTTISEHQRNGTSLEQLNRPETFRTYLSAPKIPPSHQQQQQKPLEQSHHHHHQVVMVRGASTDAATPQAEKVQYACLMKELQNAIVNKVNNGKASTAIPPSSSNTNSKSSSRQEESTAVSVSSSKNSDAEFSKELEAALQLIQDLESPNTIDTTPSEHDRDKDAWRNIHSRSDSEKTLSATGSLNELTPAVQPHQQQTQVIKNGKQGTRISVPNITTTTITTKHQNQNSLSGRSGGSQSTSGYSSPTRGNKSSTHTPVWSTTSSINGSSQDVASNSISLCNSHSTTTTTAPLALTYTIHNTKSTAVISLFAQDLTIKPKSITLVNIIGDTSPIGACVMHDTSISTQTIPETNNNTLINGSIAGKHDHNNSNNSIQGKHTRTESSASSERRSSVGSSNIWSVKSLLRKKKTAPPKLCPELEEAIIKSESLAYLSELELVARHERNTSIQRQIEQKVHQQLSIPRTSSNC